MTPLMMTSGELGKAYADRIVGEALGPGCSSDIDAIIRHHGPELDERAFIRVYNERIRSIISTVESHKLWLAKMAGQPPPRDPRPDP